MRFFIPRRNLIVLTLSILTLSFILKTYHLTSKASNQIDKRVLEKLIETWDQESPVHLSQSGLENISKENQRSSETSKVVIFFDFADPNSEKILSLLTDEQNDFLQKELVFKPVPLDFDCMNEVSNKQNQLSCNLTALSFCARQAGVPHQNVIKNIIKRFKTFNHEKALNESLLTQILLEDFSMKISQFENCRKSYYLKEFSRVLASEKSGAGIKSLPALFILNRPIDLNTKPIYLRSLFDSYVSQKDTRF